MIYFVGRTFMAGSLPKKDLGVVNYGTLAIGLNGSEVKDLLLVGGFELI